MKRHERAPPKRLITCASAQRLLRFGKLRPSSSRRKRRLNKSVPQRSGLREKKGVWDKKKKSKTGQKTLEVRGDPGVLRCVETSARGCRGQPVCEIKQGKSSKLAGSWMNQRRYPNAAGVVISCLTCDSCLTRLSWREDIRPDSKLLLPLMSLRLWFFRCWISFN